MPAKIITAWAQNPKFGNAELKLADGRRVLPLGSQPSASIVGELQVVSNKMVSSSKSAILYKTCIGIRRGNRVIWTKEPRYIGFCVSPYLVPIYAGGLATTFLYPASIVHNYHIDLAVSPTQSSAKVGITTFTVYDYGREPHLYAMQSSNIPYGLTVGEPSMVQCIKDNALKALCCLELAQRYFIATHTTHFNDAQAFFLGAMVHVGAIANTMFRIFLDCTGPENTSFDAILTPTFDTYLYYDGALTPAYMPIATLTSVLTRIVSDAISHQDCFDLMLELDLTNYLTDYLTITSTLYPYPRPLDDFSIRFEFYYTGKYLDWRNRIVWGIQAIADGLGVPYSGSDPANIRKTQFNRDQVPQVFNGVYQLPSQEPYILVFINTPMPFSWVVTGDLITAPQGFLNEEVAADTTPPIVRPLDYAVPLYHKNTPNDSTMSHYWETPTIPMSVNSFVPDPPGVEFRVFTDNSEHIPPAPPVNRIHKDQSIVDTIARKCIYIHPDSESIDEQGKTAAGILEDYDAKFFKLWNKTPL